jgi:hypothetical protein
VPVGNDLQLGTAGGSVNNLYRNSTGAAFPYTLNGIATITGNSANNATSYYYFYDWEIAKSCTSARVANTITVNTVPTPLIMASGGVLSANATNVTYEWYETTLGFVSVNAIFTPTVSGNYSLFVRSINGCRSAQSNTINVMITGTQNITQAQPRLRVYPNPAHDNCTLDLAAFANIPQTVMVYNMLGAMIFTTTTTEKILNINTQNWAKGNYIIKVTARDTINSVMVTVE